MTRDQIIFRRYVIAFAIVEALILGTFIVLKLTS